MNLNRRTLIKTGVLTAASAATLKSAAAQGPALVVFDSRLPESVAFAEGLSGAKLDVAHEDRTFWAALRAGAPKGRVVGLTRWSDLVVVRGELEAQGKRLKAERQRDPHAPFQWEMA